MSKINLNFDPTLQVDLHDANKTNNIDKLNELRNYKVQLTIERWEWAAETGLAPYEWEKFNELNKLLRYCGFSDSCTSCHFYNRKNNPNDCCFDGLFNKFRDGPDIGKRKEIANKILHKIYKKYKKD